VAEIFRRCDRAGAGVLRRADLARLERETGGQAELDAEAWTGLCELVGADAEAGWRPADLGRLYGLEGGGAEELDRVWAALQARDAAAAPTAPLEPAAPEPETSAPAAIAPPTAAAAGRRAGRQPDPTVVKVGRAGSHCRFVRALVPFYFRFTDTSIFGDFFLKRQCDRTIQGASVASIMRLHELHESALRWSAASSEEGESAAAQGETRGVGPGSGQNLRFY
jgi:hypothetical protein